METHSGDTPANRFFSYWGAVLTFTIFGVLALLFVGFESSLLSNDAEDPDDVRRTEIDNAVLEAQAKLVSTWKKNDDGSYEVPANVAISKMASKFKRSSKSAIPVPGTKAAADAAAAAALPAAAPAETDKK